MSGPIFVDSNVLLDVFGLDPVWGQWSTARIVELGSRARLIINPIVYAEVSVRFDDKSALDCAVAGFDREDIPYEAAFLAGKVYVEYRRRGGVQTSLLPDFLICAHAAVRRYPLLTRDARRYANVFSSLRLIGPPRS
ncbi:MAG: type II toxin-antitoxin system VapC family toxin [Methylobacteriaceae bacterium]|nr:type II toxin-antitoxin system VapC family toxin [Methylobacteriaceae bacterium]